MDTRHPARRSRQAAERLVERYYNEIYVFVYRQTGHKEDAMDLTQSIFLAILRALSTYDPKKAAFRTWLYRIAANKVIDAPPPVPARDYAAGGNRTACSGGLCLPDP